MMKKLNSLKLNQLSKVEIEKKEMINLKGGICRCQAACGCSDDYGTNYNTNWYADVKDNGQGVSA